MLSQNGHISSDSCNGPIFFSDYLLVISTRRQGVWGLDAITFMSDDVLIMECEIGRQLAMAFALAARQYADTVANLGRLSAMTLDPGRIIEMEEETLRRAGDALQKAEQARVAFEDHINQHRCKVPAVQPDAASDEL